MKISPITSAQYVAQTKGDFSPKNVQTKPSLIQDSNDLTRAPLSALQAYNVNFGGYYCELKRLYKKGLVDIKYSFYGGKLKPKKFSVEHVIPRSKGGKSCQANYVFCNAEQNSARGNSPLEHYIDWEAAGKYLKQFEGIKVGNFNGDEYIKQIISAIDEAIHNRY